MTKFEHEWAAPATVLPEPCKPKRVVELEAEVERLREALGLIAAYPTSDPLSGREANLIARAALDKARYGA